MEKSQKKVFVEKIKKTLDDVGILVITHYSGLKTSETDELRLKLREVGGSLQITKNSLMQIALKDNKNKELKSLFNGPIAIAYSKDEISAAKVAVNFSKEHDKLIILGGLAGNKFLEQNDVLEIASLPSLDEIRAKLITLIQTPAKNIAFALQFAATKLARVFNEYSKLTISESKTDDNTSKEDVQIKENEKNKEEVDIEKEKK